MSSDKVSVLTSLRPPVVAVDDPTPILVPTLTKKNKSGITSNFIQRTAPWDGRHQVCPSAFNNQNTSYYRTYFDKGFREKQPVCLQPKKQLDPYIENEVKGTRMPDYTSVIKDRDFYGEMAWIPNFNMTLSKNNVDRHKTYKEFFDQPKTYHDQFINSNMTSIDKLRVNAPKSSVARISHTRTSSMIQRKSLNSTMQSSKGFRQTSPLGESPKQIPFYLIQDKDNQYKYDQRVEKSIDFSNMIPFLRSPDTTETIKGGRNRSFTTGQVTMNSTWQKFNQSQKTDINREQAIQQMKKKESNWNSYIKPISQINERLHSSQKVKFEMI